MSPKQCWLPQRVARFYEPPSRRLPCSNCSFNGLSSFQPLTTMSAPSPSQSTNIDSTLGNSIRAENQMSQGYERHGLPWIITLPFHVFCEIARGMTPWELLMMARSSKLLRDMLMSKNSNQIWRAAEDAVDLPKCPPDLSSPQYASLCYGWSCMVTFFFLSKIYVVDYLTWKHFIRQQCGVYVYRWRFDAWIDLRLRLCATCKSKEIGSEEKIRSLLDIPPNVHLYQLIASYSSPFVIPTETETSFFQRLAFMSHYHSVKEATTVYDKWCSLSPKSREDYLGERRRFVYKTAVFSSKLQRWFHATDSSSVAREMCKKDEISPYKKKKKVHRSDVSYGIGIADPRKTTLIELSSGIVSSDEGKNCCISSKTFFALPHVAEIMDMDEEEELEVVLAKWEAVRIALIELIEESYQQVKGECAGMLMDVRRDAGLDAWGRDSSSVPKSQAKGKERASDCATLVHHATAFWSNPKHIAGVFVDFTLTFDGVVDALHEHSARSFAKPDENPWEGLVLEEYRPTPMTVRIAYALFAALSFPPTTTMADMEALGKKFTCGRCTKKGALKWTELVEHFHQETVIHEVCAPTRPDPHDLTAPGALVSYCTYDTA
ncbi:hypothetical protein DFH11DRAFT_1258908 [Phellopilus nigrolimitatus]|nr:hypothetical protein DFH11DRAFT_1258908 [Phellopilus nigrolimitatus]